MLIRHFARLGFGMIMLWGFFIWYVVMVVLHFEASVRLWLNAFGMSLIVGTALMLSVRDNRPANREFWRVFRLFAIPFCVSSFSALVRDDGFYAIFAPEWRDNIMALASCSVFGAFVLFARARHYGLKDA